MTPAERMRRTVAALCSPEASGRAAGTAGGSVGRAVVAAAFGELGLEARGEHGWFQLLPAMAGANLLGAIPGDGPGWIVLGAHYDHLGEVDGVVHPGADDNASGVAVMLEVARTLAAAPARGRSVLIGAYDAEEPPWFGTPDMGSQWWLDHPTIPVGAIELMVCLDIVGHRLGPAGTPSGVADTIFVTGGELAPGLARGVAVPPVPGILPRPIGDWVEEPLSDHRAFRAAGIPFLFYTCARFAAYHTPRDVPERLDFTKMAALADHVAAVIGQARTAPSGAWEFDRAGADDTATIDTLLAIAAELPEADLEAIQALERMRGPSRLDDDDRHWIQALVEAFENLLG